MGLGGGILTQYKYAGFMSYAHADEAMAARLHHAIETYKVPRDLSLGPHKTLKPIFRDTAELTAHHSLSEKIQEAVNGSRFLIVLCSPAAKDSHWVNEEIRLFRSIHGEASILCVLIDGTPETSFPPNLVEGGREPLAANIGQSRDSFRLGVTQLAASMLGVGLDELIQRDAKRRRNRLRVLSGASLAFAVVMGGMAWTAIDARDEAEVSRTEAEKMVEFMLTDLKQDLEPVGKLNILDDVGKRVSDYYQAIPISDMDDDRLARQARARHLLGQVALDQRKMEKAKTEIEAAYAATAEVLRHNPDDTDAIFAHAQSAYWIGAVYYYTGDYHGALPHWEKYSVLGETLYNKDIENLDWIMERGWGVNNIALLHNRLGDFGTAQTYYLKAESYFNTALQISPGSPNIEKELANVFEGLAQMAIEGADYEKSLQYRHKNIDLYDIQLARQIDNKSIRYRRVQVHARIVMDGLLDDNPTALSDTLMYTFDEFDNLISFDPENKKWQSNYKNYLTELLNLVSNESVDSAYKIEIESRLSRL